MKQYFLTLFKVALAVFTMQSIPCKAEHNVISNSASDYKRISVESFSKVKVTGPIDLILTQGTQQTNVSYSDPDNYVESFSVSDGVLNITMKKNVGSKEAPKFNITELQLEGLQTSGPTVAQLKELDGKDLDIQMSGPTTLMISSVTYHNMNATISGPCTVKGELNSKVLNMACNGPSTTTLKVSGEDCKMHWSGPSKSDITFTGNHIKVEESGPSDSKFNVNCETVNMNINGPGKATVSGTANNSNINSSGPAAVVINTNLLNKK